MGKGNVMRLSKIVDLCRRYAVLIMDDSHGVGVLGQGSRGTHEHYQLPGCAPDSIDILAAAVHGTAKPAPEELGTTMPSPARPAAKNRQGTKGVLIHVQPAMWQKMQQLALDEKTSV